MAYLSDFAWSGLNGSVSAVAQNMPEHQANDILVAHIVVDSSTITVSGSSWAALPSAPANPVTQGIVSYLYYVKAAGSSETLTLTTADAYVCMIYCWRDVDGTTPFDGVTPKHAGVASTTTTPVNESVTTGTADALVVFHIGMDGTTPQVLSDPGVMSIYNADSTGTTATTSSNASAAWYIQRATGASPVANWSTSNAADDYVRATYALRNASGGKVPAYVDDVSSPATRLTCGHHVSTQNNISYSGSGSFVVTANIAGKTLTQAAAANGADFGINPYANAVTAAAAATARTALTGPELVLTSGRDLSTGLICGSFIAGTPKMGAFGLGSIGQGGVVVRVASGANNWNAYQVAAKDSVPNPVQRCVFAIQAGYAGSDYDTGSSGSASASSITYVQFLRNAPAFSSTVYMSELHQVKTHVVAGGDTNNPVDVDGMAEVGQSFRLPVIQKVGSSGLLSFAPIQIGGGDAVNFQIDAGSLQFPRRADTSKKELQFHAADNTLGISYAGKSGDVVRHTNSLISSPTPFYWEINASATSAATWDFTGLSIIGGNVTLRDVMTFDGMSFTSCPTLVFSSCDVTNGSISSVPATNDSLTTNSSTTVSACSINTTTLTAGNRWASVSTADLDMFSDCTFTGSTTSGHAIRLSSTGSVSFSGNTFTSYGPAARSFNAATGVNTTTDVITLDDSHGYANGEPAYFQDQGGTAPTGLTDGSLYYVRSESSTTITLYDTAAHAIAGGATGRADITATGSGTQYIYSAAAAIYNNSGGAVTITITNGGNIPSYRNSDGSSTTIVANVNVTVTILDQAGDPIPGVEVAIFQDNTSRTVVLASAPTNASGQVTTTASQNLGAIIIRARQSTSIATFSTSQAFTSEVVTTDANHDFQDGDAVLYTANGGSQNIGLTEGSTYYINRITDTTLSLHDTAADAIADTSRKDLTTSGSETHLLNPVRYIPGSATGSIGTSDFTTQITLITDSIASG